MEFRCKPLDAKAERAVLQRAKDEMQQELSACCAGDANSALDIGTCLAAAIFRRCGGGYCVLLMGNILVAFDASNVTMFQLFDQPKP